MKAAEVIETYYDKELHRTVAEKETLTLADKRFEELSTKNNGAGKPLVKEKAVKQKEEKEG